MLATTLTNVIKNFADGSESAYQRDSFNKLIDDLIISLANGCLANPAIAIGTTVQKVKTVNSISYRILGRIYTKAATDDLFTLSGATIPDGSTGKFLLCLDNAGAASVVALTPYVTTGAQAAMTDAQVALIAQKCVVGLVAVATAGATFVPGTTALNAGTVTAVYQNGFDIQSFGRAYKIVPHV